MLNVFRKHRKGIFASFVAGLTIILMAGFGMGGAFDSGQKNKTAAITINGKEIGFDEYSRNYERLVNYYRTQYKENFENFRQFLNLEQQTIDGIVAQRLLKDLQDKFGFHVSLEQIEKEIKNNPSYGAQLKDKQAFKDYLKQVGLTSSQLEALIREQLENQQLQKVLGQLSLVSEQELKKTFFENKKELAFSYLEFKSSAFEDKVDTSKEDELKKHFEENKEAYEKPRSVKYNFVGFKAADYKDKVEVLDEDLKIAYEERKAELYLPKKVRLQQIVLKKHEKAKLDELFEEEPKKNAGKKKKEKLEKKPSENELKKQTLEKAIASLENGKDFTKLAKKISEEKEEIDLGWKTIDQLSEEQRNAIAEIDLGETSEIVENEKELKIFKLAEVEVERLKTLEEVKDELTAQIKEDNAPAYMTTRTEALFAEFQQGDKKLADFAKGNGLLAVELDKLFSKNETIPGVPNQVTEQVLPLNVGEKDLIEVSGEAFLVEVVETKDAYTPELAEVKDAVVASYKKEKAKELAKAEAEKALSEIAKITGLTETRKALKDYAERNSLELKVTELKTKDTSSERFLTAPEIKLAAFSLSKEAPLVNKVYEFGGDQYLIALKKEKLASDADFAKEKDGLKSSIEAQAQSRLLSAIVARLKAEADIDVDASLIKRQDT